MLEMLMALAVLGQVEIPPLPGFVPVAPRASAPPLAGEPVHAEKVHDTSDMVAWAVQDLMLRQPADRPFIRYLAVPPWGSVDWHQVNSFIVNAAVSQSSVIVLPEGVAGGWLIVWDLRRLAPKEPDLARLLVVWNALAKEPYFHVQLSKAVACRSYLYIDGKTYTGRTYVPAPHVAEGYSILERETNCFAPLLRADDFLRRVASTIDGGLYYHFIGFVRDGKRLTEAEIFKQVGLDVAVSRGVEGDDRAAVFQSAITGKPRTVEQVQGAIGKARITFDIFDEDTDASRHAIYELLDSVNRARGKEIIFERANGLFGYFLTDGAGKLVDVAPPNLAADHRTPEPVTKQLYPPLSCIRCHGPEGGVKVVRNDVPTLLGGGKDGEVDLFDDLSSRANRNATVDRLAGLYSAGDAFGIEADLSRSRFADAVWRSTRGMGVSGSEKVAVKAAESLAAAFSEYWYPRTLTEANVNADRACLEWGYRVPAGQGAAWLRQTLKPQRADFTVEGVPVEAADPSLAALRRGMSIRRQDFERVHALGAYQLLEARK